jgi:hypothetical protein
MSPPARQELPGERRTLTGGGVAPCGKILARRGFWLRQAAGPGLALFRERRTPMFGSISLALGALSTVSSLVQSVASEIDKATSNAQSPAQTFSPSAAQTTPSDPLTAAPKDPGVVFPKFDQRMQAALLALQAQHRGA